MVRGAGRLSDDGAVGLEWNVVRESHNYDMNKPSMWAKFEEHFYICDNVTNAPKIWVYCFTLTLNDGSPRRYTGPTGIT